MSLAPALAHADGEAILTVKVENVSPKGGNLRLALYDRATYEANAAPLEDKTAPATPGTDLVTFAPHPPGIYAIKMYQDENRDEKFQRSLLGLPLEPYGFSNDAPADLLHLGPARFDAAKITLKPGANEISIRLR